MRKAIARDITEADVEHEVCHILTALRVTFLKTTVRLRRRTGQTRGIPDILARRRSWPAGMWIGLELKRPVGWEWSHPEQKDVHEMGGSFIVHSAEDAIAAVKATDEALASRKEAA